MQDHAEELRPRWKTLLAASAGNSKGAIKCLNFAGAYDCESLIMKYHLAN
jgi:hypothetical protein